jgi:hypothetical protein
MKHLKKFNESAFDGVEKIRELEHELNNALFTPKNEQVPLKSLYKIIVIKTKDPINIELFQSHAVGLPGIYDTNWILLQFRFGKFVISFYPGENDINSWLKSGYPSKHAFTGDFRDYLMLDYNDINHAEIENILSEYGVVVDEMWGIPL